MSNRDNRAKIAQDTLGILNRGFYQNKLGEIVDISESLKAAKTGSIHYTPEMLQRENCLPAQASQKTTFFVSIETTLHAASRLVNCEGIEKVLCLNFASAKNPGGGFLNGSQCWIIPRMRQTLRNFKQCLEGE